MSRIPIIHPGSMIEHELEYLNITHEDAALYLEIGPEELEGIIEGRYPITDELADKAEEYLCLNADMLKRWQKAYNEKVS